MWRVSLEMVIKRKKDKLEIVKRQKREIEIEIETSKRVSSEDTQR
jgi:hypothetical protein